MFSIFEISINKFILYILKKFKYIIVGMNNNIHFYHLNLGNVLFIGVIHFLCTNLNKYHNLGGKTMDWIIPANANIYDCASAFQKDGYIDWRQNANYSIGDIVYIYCTRPYMRIMYKTKVEKVNLDSSQIVNDEEFWVNKSEYTKSLSGKYVRLILIKQANDSRLCLDKLKKNGLNGVPQSAVKIKSEGLKNYIDRFMEDYKEIGVFPESDDMDTNIYEGAKVSVKVNKYERSSIARHKCIEYHGSACKVCGINFENLYGEIGKGFIHVHHIIPISKINREYVIDYKNDLIPVCPNCHSMLHRKVDGRNITVEDLRELIKNK